MGTKAQELVDGCFAKAADDEPLFVLRAQDTFAPALIRAWRNYFWNAHTVAGPNGTVWDSQKSYDKWFAAGETMKAMEEWPTRKTAD